MTNKIRTYIAIVTSVIILIAVTISVAIFGIVDNPKFQKLSDTPDDSIAGTIAFKQYKKGDSSKECIYATEATGRSDVKEVYCTEYSSLNFSWLTDGRLAVSDNVGGVTKFKILNKDGSNVETIAAWANYITLPVPPALYKPFSATSRDSYAIVERNDNTSTEPVIKVKKPASYEFTSAESSPDRKYMLITDNRARVLIAEQSGANIRQLASAAPKGEATWNTYDVKWFQPGFAENTVTLEQVKEASGNWASTSPVPQVESIPAS